jgi:hypothetical protein
MAAKNSPQCCSATLCYLCKIGCKKTSHHSIPQISTWAGNSAWLYHVTMPGLGLCLGDPLCFTPVGGCSMSQWKITPHTINSRDRVYTVRIPVPQPRKRCKLTNEPPAANKTSENSEISHSAWNVRGPRNISSIGSPRSL